ncbi:MAG: DUF4271 domain-containing protein [Cyclobacteriaceae bacterium]|nr:DUF4271 domain-containing protein [Cyclobacteriaceae bacterium]
MKHIIFSLVISLVSCVQLFSQDTLRIDISNKWFYTDANGVKHVAGDGKIKNTFHLSIDFDDYKEGIVGVTIPKGTSFFVNSKIISIPTSDDGVYNFPVSKEMKMISVYHPIGIEKIQSELMLPNIKSQQKIESVKIREADIYENFLMTSLLLLLFLYSYNKTRSSELFSNHFKFFRAISIRTIGEAMFKIRILEKSNLMLLFTHSLGMSLVLISVINKGALLNHLLNWFKFETYLESVLLWLLLGILIWGVLLLKSALVSVFTMIFKLNAFRRVHFYSYLRITIFIYAVGLLLFIYFTYQLPEINPSSIVINVGLILMFFRIVIVFVKLLNVEKFRFLYLFSYICATEILPYVYMAKTMY